MTSFAASFCVTTKCHSWNMFNVMLKDHPSATAIGTFPGEHFLTEL